jgi:uncharacterized protein (TIGR03437 family)
VLPTVLAVSPLDPNLVYAGARTGLYRSTDGGDNWTLIPSLMSQYQTAIFYRIAIDPLQPSRVWVVAANTPQPSGLFTSGDGGSTWQGVALPAPGGLGGFGIAQGIALDPNHSGTVYAAGQSMPIYKSTDSGQTWNLLASVFGTVELDPSNPSTIYSLTGFGLEKSTDGGKTFVKTGFNPTGLSAFAIDPANPSRLYAASSQALYTSGDGGTTWTPTSIHAVAQLAVLPGRLLVGAQIPSQVYVAKFSPDLSETLWATYLGGGGYHSVTGLAVDSSGNAYVTGRANAPDFPVTPNALQGTPPSAMGGAFAAKISADGTQLMASTYFGNGSTFPRAIAVDPSGAIYVAGAQQHGGLATTPNTLQPALPGDCQRPRDQDNFFPQNFGAAFVAKLGADLSKLAYSTYLTGTCGSDIFGMSVDDSGVATVVGGTYSLDFPTTAGAMATTPPGSYESAFLTQVSADGGSLVYSTYLGGGPLSEARALTLDAAGNWYVTGDGSPAPTPEAAHPTSTGFCSPPLFTGLRVPQPPTAQADAFVIVFNARSTSPMLSATVGGSCYDEGDSIALDGAGNIWIAGFTGSLDVPSQGRVGGLGPPAGGFLAALSPSGSHLLSIGYTGNTPRLAASGGSVVGTAASELRSTLLSFTQSSYTTALAEFDAVSAPPVELDELNDYSGSGTRSAVVPGKVMRVSGRNFGPAQTVAGTVVSGRVADAIEGLQVLFDGIAAPLLALQDQSVTLVVPFEIQNRHTTVMQVTRDGRTVSNPITLPVFNLDSDVLLVLNHDGTMNSAQHPAPAGSTIGVFVTGLGAQNSAVADGLVATTPSPAPTVTLGPGITFGEVTVQPSYVGAAVGFVAGIVQVNVTVPEVDGSKGPVLLQSPQFRAPVYVSAAPAGG